MPERLPLVTAEGDRIAVGVFTATSSFDPEGACAVLADTTVEDLRAACMTLSGAMAGLIFGYALQHGIDPMKAMRSAATNFAELTRALDGRHG